VHVDKSAYDPLQCWLWVCLTPYSLPVSIHLLDTIITQICWHRIAFNLNNLHLIRKLYDRLHKVEDVEMWSHTQTYCKTWRAR
jgi:hypothetical protein